MADVLIIEARYYDEISDELVRGAIAELESRGVSYERLEVPGALEIPIALSIALRQGRVGVDAKCRGCIALGCVVRGETSHHEIVGRESARALMQLGAAHGLPVGNGILTVETREQARARARVEGGNKGGHAAIACLALMELADRPAVLPGK